MTLAQRPQGVAHSLLPAVQLLPTYRGVIHLTRELAMVTANVWRGSEFKHKSAQSNLNLSRYQCDYMYLVAVVRSKIERWVKMV